jgi:NADH pyrophosphatase NudC (nudix superfamily)
MIIALASLLVIAVLGFILTVRTEDLPELEPVSPFAHLDERKAAIYDNLRDAQFEFRVGKLSDEDYQQTKLGLQKELAAVMAEVNRIKATLPQPAVEPAKKASKAAAAASAQTKSNVCPSCGAQFAQSLKFCGECGKPMKVRA